MNLKKKSFYDKMIFDTEFSKVSSIRKFTHFHYNYDGPKQGYGFHNPNEEYIDIDYDNLKLNRATMTTYASIHYDEEYIFSMIFKCDNSADNILSIAGIDVVLNVEDIYRWYKVEVEFTLPKYEYTGKGREEKRGDKIRDGKCSVLLITEDGDLIDYISQLNWNQNDVGFITVGSIESQVLYKRITLKRVSEEEPDIYIPYTKEMATEIIKENL